MLMVEKTLLLYVPVPIVMGEEGLLYESQACNGLRLWAENFDRVIVMSPRGEKAPSGGVWLPVVKAIPNLDRIEFHSLPEASRPDRFLRQLPETRRLIRQLIARADYLCFAIGGFFGDWGMVSCMEAHQLGRPYAVWTDRVESEVLRQSFGDLRFAARMKARLIQPTMAYMERRVVRRATLGLFHGRETFEAYSPHCRGRSEMVHDIHISHKDHIAPEALQEKQADAVRGPLRICYTGRVDAMKGPFDWLKVLRRLAERGVDFQATWLGDGSLRLAMQRRVGEYGLTDRVIMPGFASARESVLDTLRQSHLMLFCHKTPESPRCLIEALISGTPIVGYDSAFPRDLIAAHGGGRLVPRDDIAGLADQVADLDRDRSVLANLMAKAAADGAPFADTEVFQHRSALIKQYLPPVRSD